jgi:hypothetical protein
VSLVVVPAHRSTREPSLEFTAAVPSRAAVLCARSAASPPQPPP